MKPKIRRPLFAALILGAVAAAPVAEAGPRTGASATGSKANDKTNLTDAQILGVADTANTGEIAQANIAVSKAQVESVRQFAQLMIKDHSEAKEKGRSLGTELGLTPATSPLSAGVQKDGDDAMAQLEKAQPGNFDRTYMQTQVRLHQKVLRTLDDLIPQADAPQLKSLLGDMRMHVEHHLTTARSTLATLGK